MGKSTSKGKRVSAKTKAGSARSRRKRHSDVRGIILKALAAGASSVSQIQEHSECSIAALYLNLKSLRAEGLLESRRQGRYVLLRLADKATEVAVASNGQIVGSAPPSSIAVQSAVDRDLYDALASVRARMSPVSGVPEKLTVLMQLAQLVPEPVAEVLRAVIDDMARLTELPITTRQWQLEGTAA